VTPHGLRTRFEASVERADRKPLVAWFGGIPLKRQKYAVLTDRQHTGPVYPNRQLVTRLLKGRCELCKRTDNISVHHVRTLAELNRSDRPQPPMGPVHGKIRRKALVVCGDCHDLIAGTPPHRSRSSHWRAGYSETGMSGSGAGRAKRASTTLVPSRSPSLPRSETCQENPHVPEDLEAFGRDRCLMSTPAAEGAIAEGCVASSGSWMSGHWRSVRGCSARSSVAEQHGYNFESLACAGWIAGGRVRLRKLDHDGRRLTFRSRLRGTAGSVAVADRAIDRRKRRRVCRYGQARRHAAVGM